MMQHTMKRKITFFIGLLALLGLVAGTIMLISRRTPKQGELSVESTPEASVYLENKHLGRTPYDGKVDAGEYTIRIVSESTTPQFSAWQGKIVVGSNLLTFVKADLAESELSTAADTLWLEKTGGKSSEAVITTNPDGVTVSLDGETKGVTPTTLSDISAGDHSLTMSSPGFVTRTLKIKTNAGYRVVITVKLALSPGTSEPVASPSATPTESEEGPTPTQGGKPTPTPSKPSPTVADPAKPFIIIQDTPTGFLRVRMGPSVSATEAGKVNPGEKYTILDEENDWYEIEYDKEKTGWVTGQYAEKVE